MIFLKNIFLDNEVNLAWYSPAIGHTEIWLSI